jgi:hypothetical protein
LRRLSLPLIHGRRLLRSAPQRIGHMGGNYFRDARDRAKNTRFDGRSANRRIK